MPYKAGSQKSVDTIQAIATQAKASPDAILAEKAVLDIAVSAAPVDLRAELIEGIVRAHWNTTNVVVVSLTSLIPLNVTTLRTISHALLAERFHPDRDMVLARAATVLLEISPHDISDIPPICKALGSRIDLIHNNTKRAIQSLAPSRALGLLSIARDASATCDTSQLVKTLEDRLSNKDVYIPPRPITPTPEVPRPAPAPPSDKKPSPQPRQRKERSSVSSPRPSPMPSTQVNEPPTSSPATEIPQRDLTAPAASNSELSELTPPTSSALSAADLQEIANTSRDHSKILSSITELMARHGRQEALKCMNGFIWAISDPENPLKQDFGGLADKLFPN